MAGAYGLAGSFTQGRSVTGQAFAPRQVPQPEPPPMDNSGAQLPGVAQGQVRGMMNTSAAYQQAPQTTTAQRNLMSYIPKTDDGGVSPGVAPKVNAVQQAQGPDLASIQAEMQRRQVGAQLNKNPDNSALAGYMMG